jgi:hypothetical protein
MRFICKAAVSVAAAGLAAVGAVTAGGGVANAATNQVAVSCSTDAVVLTAGALASCTEGATTVVNPTSFTLTTSSPGLTGTVLSTLSTTLTSLGLGDVSTIVSQLQNLTENVSFDVACSVDGQTNTQHESYTALADGTSKTINLQSAVGSPAPNSCTIENFTVKSLVSLSALDIALINGLPSSILSTSGGLLGPLSGLLQLLGLPTFTGLTGGSLTDLLGLSISAQLTANTAVPGAVYQVAAKTGGFAVDLCADDANNGNAGSVAQTFQCNSDLAQSFVQASTGQLVRNGDCLTQQGSGVSLQACGGSAAQVWNVTGTGGHFGEIVNASSHQCLTAPKVQAAVQLTGTACTGKANQQWAGPAKSAA